ncbi:MAG: short-chain fatty acyl-CoA regulator family protein [Pseudomonadota bacterium]
MPEQKVFAGPRVRRIRKQLNLTQTAMAADIGVSPSYLNLIERNQRPLTNQLVLKLAGTYDIDLEDLQGASDSMLPQLKQAFADPLLAGELQGDAELVELCDAAPNVANAMLKLHRAYKEGMERLTDLSDMLAREGRETALSSAKLPMDEVRDTLEKRANHYPRIEEEAESFLKLLDCGDDLRAGLRDWLHAERNMAVQVLPVATMPVWRRKYDRHSKRLFVSERLGQADQLREIAMEAALIRMEVAITAEIEELNLSSQEAERLMRFEFARYAAHALMMPYERFLKACHRSKYDLDVLRSRFAVTFEHVANRLTTLQRAGQRGIPFFMSEIDQAGNRFRRAGARGYPHARFGGACPKLPVHEAFYQPGHILVEAVQMPDGNEFLVIARTFDGPQGGFNERPRHTAVLLGCEIAHRNDVIYGQALRTDPASPDRVVSDDIGPACRVCERTGCMARAEPPITRPLGLDDSQVGMSAFDFV